MRQRVDGGYSLHHVKTALAFALLALGSACSSPLKAPTVQGPPPDYVEPAPAAAGDPRPATSMALPLGSAPNDAGAAP